MAGKLVVSIKSLFSSHSGMMIICMLLMVGAFWSISGASIETGGIGIFGLLLPLAACLGMLFVMHRFMGHGGHDPENAGEAHEKDADGHTSIDQKKSLGSIVLETQKQG